MIYVYCLVYADNRKDGKLNPVQRGVPYIKGKITQIFYKNVYK